MEIVIGDNVGRISEADRYGRDGRVRIAETRQDHHRHAGQRETEHDAADELADEGNEGIGQLGGDGLRHVRIALANQELDAEAEGGNRDGIVEQQFAFGQDRQALGRSDVAKDANHRRRVGGRHDRPQQQAHHDVDAGRQMDRARNARDADQDGDDRHQQDGEDLVEQSAHVDRQAGREQQGRQEQRQEDVGAALEPVEPEENIAHHAEAMAAPGDPGAEEAQPHAGDRQQDGVRQAQPFGQWHEQADQAQHHREREQGVEDVGHRPNLPCLKGMSAYNR